MTTDRYTLLLMESGRCLGVTLILWLIKTGKLWLQMMPPGQDVRFVLSKWKRSCETDGQTRAESNLGVVSVSG